MAGLTAQDKKWQAESDVRSLAEADIIRQTPGRLNPAKKAAKGMAVNAKKEAKAMVKVANVKKRNNKPVKKK